MTHRPTRPTRRGFTAGFAALVPALCLPALAQGAAATVTLSGTAFGTLWRITLPGGDHAALRPAIVRDLAELDAEMSPWRPDSLLSRINAMPAGVARVTPEFEVVFAAAKAVGEASGGAFDPRVGPAVARWGFGPIEGPARAGRFVLDGGRLAKHGAATLDLCGIAKGRALDRLADLLRARGREDFLIDIGGELLAGGRHPEGRAWRAGIEDPRPEATGLALALPLDGAIATSGIKTQSYLLGSRRYSHIIDPRSMAPARTAGLLSVSVLAPGAMLADAWSTALMAAGPRRGPELAEVAGIDALFLFDGPAGLRHRTTGRFGA